MTDISSLEAFGLGMLSVHDRFMGGERGGDTPAAKHLFLAAAYGAQAFEQCPIPDAAVSAMLRAFLVALVDPLHPDLDYLRIDPASGETARAERKAGAI